MDIQPPPGPDLANKLGVEVWRGAVSPWECDEMGHLNVRFYTARAMDGLAGLARRLGMPQAFAPAAAATLIVRQHHVRFLQEARAGAPLAMTAGLLNMGESDAEVLQVMTHADDAPCATFRTRLVHATPDGRAFPWPSRARAHAEGLRIQAPPFAQPRSLPLDSAVSTASLARADALGLTCVGRCVIGAQDCDAFGFARLETFTARFSDGAAALTPPLREALQTALGLAHIGGAALEHRALYLGRPRVGDHVEVRSGFTALEGKTHLLTHWALDPETARPWATGQVLGVSFDLDARRSVTAPAAVRARLAETLAPEAGL